MPVYKGNAEFSFAPDTTRFTRVFLGNAPVVDVPPSPKPLAFINVTSVAGSATVLLLEGTRDGGSSLLGYRVETNGSTQTSRAVRLGRVPAEFREIAKDLIAYTVFKGQSLTSFASVSSLSGAGFSGTASGTAVTTSVPANVTASYEPVGGLLTVISEETT
jgi:hypothetical protein